MSSVDAGAQNNSAVKDPSSGATSLVHHVAQGIREIVFEREPGALIGSEDELLQRFGVSRPTFRQAAKLVEQEQLMTIRRGVGGGYFGCRPDSAIVGKITALYLRSKRCTLAHIVAAVRPLYVATARLAVTNMSKEQEEAFNEFARMEISTLETPPQQIEILASEKAFARMFAESSGNPLIQLFIDIILDLSARSGENVWTKNPDRIKRTREDRLFLIEAIVRRDVEMAEMAAKRMTENMAKWVLELPSTKATLDFPDLA